MNNYKQISTTLKQDGIAENHNWLSEDEINFITQKILKLSRAKGENRSHLPINKLSILLKTIKFQFTDIFFSLYLQNLSKKLNLKNISNDFFGCESELKNIDFYVSKKSTDPVLDWHVDKAYSGKKDVYDYVKPDDFGLKFIFYLTDVSKDNGCLKYIPKSNKIAYALKKGIYEKEIKYSPYWKMNDFCELVTMNSQLIKKYVDSNDLNQFYDLIKQLKNDENSNNFYHEINKGGGIIFDESGIHKGTEPKNNDRLIFRYIFTKKLKN